MKLQIRVILIICLLGGLTWPSRAAASDMEQAGGICAIGFGAQLSVIKVVSDPDGLALSLDIPHKILLGYTAQFCFDPPSISVYDACDNPFDGVELGRWITVSGPWDGSHLSLSGMGTLAGFQAVHATFEGTQFGLGGNGRYGRHGGGLNGIYTVGVNGELGGQPVVYEVTRKPGKMDLSDIIFGGCT